MSTRSATSAYKGYTYQRARLIHLIFCEYYNEELNNKISFCEENLEDIDFFVKFDTQTTDLHLYQEKHYNTSTSESLTKDSGLTKVIISHFNNKKVKIIKYELMTTSGTISYTNSLQNYVDLLRDNTNKHLIGKYLVLNFCDTQNKFYNKKYQESINYMNTYNEEMLKTLVNNTYTDEKVGNSTNLHKLREFCYYCADQTNIENLITYLNKIIIINNNERTMEHLLNETLTRLKILLPEFEKLTTYMSDQYKEFYCQMLYGLFEMFTVKILFRINETQLEPQKITIQEFVDEIKLLIKNSITEDDKLAILVYTISHFINKKEFDILKNKLFGVDNSLVTHVLKNKITITHFIHELKKQKVEDTNEIRYIIRDLINDVCKYKAYNYVHKDERLLGFLYRTHKQKILNLKGYKFPALDKIDNLIKE